MNIPGSRPVRSKYVGMFDSGEQAAIAGDRVAFELGHPIEALNFPEHYREGVAS